MATRSKPKAVLTSDVHVSLNNRRISMDALELTFKYARDAKLPVIIAGDLHDSKAALRGECVNDLISLFKKYSDLRIIVIPGNHCLLSERSDQHALAFLEPHCELYASTHYDEALDLWLIPYQNSCQTFLSILHSIPKGATVIAHQGVMSAFMGEYTQDKTSVSPEELDGYRIISGHYHRAQDIVCGSTGLFTYIGTPYTITAAEANDGPKGFQVLHTDGTLKQVPTNLRKHVKVERTVHDVLEPIDDLNPDDLLWLKVSGPATELDRLNKRVIGEAHLGHQNFKLDKVYTEVTQVSDDTPVLTPYEAFDTLIDESDESANQKIALKNLWRKLCA